LERFSVLHSGAIKVGKGENVHERYHTLVLSNGGPNSDENGVWLEHASTDEGAQAEEARFFLVAGKPLDQEVFQMGPFVLNTRQQAFDAVRDYQ